ncbi:MAG: HEAT repeat domain-containing protein [Candidatus Sericytochromatia bacterium]
MKDLFYEYKNNIDKLSSINFEERRNAIEIISSLHEENLYKLIADFLFFEDAITRNSAIEILTAWGKNVTNLLIEKTKSDNHNVRIFACNILGDIRDQVSVEALLTLLTDDESNVRFAAYEAIGKIGSKEATLPLLQYLYSNQDNPWEQFPLIITLGQLQDERCLVPLLQLAENEMLKQPVLQAISNIADERAIPYIIDALHTQDEYIQHICMLIIKTMKDRIEDNNIRKRNLINIISSYLETKDKKNIDLIISVLDNLLNHEEYSIKIGCVFLLSIIATNNAVKVIIKHYFFELDIEILEAFLIIKDKNISALIKFFNQAESGCKNLIIVALGKSSSTKAYNMLIKLLSNKSNEIKIQALDALGNMSNNDCLDSLISLFSNNSIDVKNALVNNLKKFSGKDFQKKLIDRIIDDDKNFTFILDVLLNIKPLINFTFIKKFINHTDFKVRKNIAEVLYNYKEEEVLDILVNYLSDEHYQVKDSAIRSIANLEEKYSKYLLSCLNDNEPWVRYSVIKSISKQNLSVEAINNLLPLLDDEAPFVKIAVIEALGELKMHEFSDFLFHFIIDLDFDISETAINSLSNFDMNEEEQIKFLNYLIIQTYNENWIVRKAVSKALGKIKNKNALEILLSMLASEYEEIVDFQIMNSILKHKLDNSIMELFIELINLNTTKNTAIKALANAGEEILLYIKNIFELLDNETKISLISVLEKINSSKSMSLLLKYASEDSSPNVRKHALLSLNTFIKDQRAMWAIMWAANNDSDFVVKQTAKMMLVSQKVDYI